MQGAIAAASPEYAAVPAYQVPTLSEGRHIPRPPIMIPVAPARPDRRPVWVGAGLVVIAAMFWWNQRRRASLERPSRKSDA